MLLIIVFNIIYIIIIIVITCVFCGCGERSVDLSVSGV